MEWEIARWFDVYCMFLFQLQEEAFNAFYGACGIKGQESEKLSWWDLTAGTLGATCVFQRNFSFSGFWHAEPRSTTSHTRPHAQRGNQCTAGRLAFSVFLTAVSGLKGEAAAFFVFPPLSHLEHWGHPLSSLLLSVLFLHLFLFYTIWPRVLFVLLRLQHSWVSVWLFWPEYIYLLLDWIKEQALHCSHI